MTLEQLLSEPVATARRREQTSFSGQTTDKLVLFGAGTLGRRVLAVLRRHGIEPLAFADRSPGLEESQVSGLQVLSPHAAAKHYGATATFIVTIFRGAGDGGMASRERLLRELGCRKVMTFHNLAWKYAADFLPYYGAALPSVILSAASEIARVAAAWGDAESREVFRAQLLWRLRGDFSAMKVQAPDQYFPKDLFGLTPNESFVDGGAFDGDTLRILGNNFARAWAIEPDPANAARLRSAGDPRVTVFECALGAAAGEATFSAERGVASALSAVGGTRVTIETLDRLLSGQSPSLLKLDVEGAEQAALQGARLLMERSQPTVAVCLYHRWDDLWKIPLFLKEVLPRHRLFLRAHENDGYELVAYAVPPERCR